MYGPHGILLLIKMNTSKNSLSYWLNLLQNLKNEKNIFLTLNPIKKISEDKILKKINFTHPYYDQKALDNQKNLKTFKIKKIYCFVEVISVTVFMRMA